MPAGHFVVTGQSTPGKTDGIAASVQSPKDHKAALAASQAERKAAMETIGKTWNPKMSSWDKTLAESFDPSIGQRQIQVAHLSVNTDEEDEEESEYEEPPPRKGKKKSSPTSATLNTSGSSGKGSTGGVSFGDTTSSPEVPKAPPKPTDKDERLYAILGDLASQIKALQAKDARKSNDRSDDDSSAASRRRRRKAKQQKKPSKQASKQSKKAQRKGRRRRHEGTPPSSDDSSGTSSKSSHSKGAQSSRHRPKADSDSEPEVRFYAVVRGKKSTNDVVTDRKLVYSLREANTLVRGFSDEDDAWVWLERMLNKASATKTSVSQAGPSAPPISLSGNDPSVGKPEAVFGIDLHVGSKELEKSLCPPGVDPQTAKDLCGTMLDAVSLPGKLASNSEMEEALGGMSSAMLELAAMKRAEGGEETRLDMKWQSQNRNALRNIKTMDDLLEHQSDVLEIMHPTMQRVMVTQNTILLKMNWERQITDAWTYGGPITIISRRAAELYLALIQHILTVATDGSWNMAKEEIEFYVKRFLLTRQMAASRLHCMINLYVFLRDQHAKAWQSSKLDGKRIRGLQKQYDGLTCIGVGSSKGGKDDLCEWCATRLHAIGQCPWSTKSKTLAKKGGKAALKAMAAGKGPPIPAGGGDEEKDEG